MTKPTEAAMRAVEELQGVGLISRTKARLTIATTIVDRETKLREKEEAIELLLEKCKRDNSKVTFSLADISIIEAARAKGA